MVDMFGRLGEEEGQSIAGSDSIDGAGRQAGWRLR